MRQLHTFASVQIYGGKWKKNFVHLGRFVGENATNLGRSHWSSLSPCNRNGLLRGKYSTRFLLSSSVSEPRQRGFCCSGIFLDHDEIGVYMVLRRHIQWKSLQPLTIGPLCDSTISTRYSKARFAMFTPKDYRDCWMLQNCCRTISIALEFICSNSIEMHWPSEYRLLVLQKYRSSLTPVGFVTGRVWRIDARKFRSW
jgi:hypothetical protein